jgi:hypothetical protein
MYINFSLFLTVVSHLQLSLNNSRYIPKSISVCTNQSPLMFYCNFSFCTDNLFAHKSSLQIFTSLHSSKVYTLFFFAIHKQYLPISRFFSAVPFTVLSSPHVLHSPIKRDEYFLFIKYRKRSTIPLLTNQWTLAYRCSESTISGSAIVPRVCGSLVRYRRFKNSRQQCRLVAWNRGTNC